MCWLKRVNSHHFFLTQKISFALFRSLFLSFVKRRERGSETLDRSTSEFHDDEFVFYQIILVLVFWVISVSVRGILRTLIRGENQPLVYDFPVGDLGGVTSVDAVGETIHHAMRVFTVILCDRTRHARLVDEERVRNSARDGD